MCGPNDDFFDTIDIGELTWLDEDNKVSHEPGDEGTFGEHIHDTDFDELGPW